MSKIYENYSNNIQCCWYDSSNVIFSKCYDNDGDEKVVKIIFKNGRTYLYKGVNVYDYINFRDAQSNGSAFNKYMSKYTAVRIQDTDLDKLNELKEKFMNEEKELQQTEVGDLDYVIEFVNKTGEFALKRGDKVVYSGIEGKVSIVDLFTNMGINSTLKEVDEIVNITDEDNDKIDVE